MSFGKKSKSVEGPANQGNAAATAELRRQFNQTRSDLLPFIEAGERQLPVLESRATIEGLDAVLSQIFNSENFQTLRDERINAAEGVLASGGLIRSGTALEEVAAIPTDLGFAIESLLTGRSQSLAGQSNTTATNLGQIGASNSQAIANLTQSHGNNISQTRGQAGQNFLNTAATAASIFFSDPSLKENVEEIGEIDGLKVYQWDWIEKAKDTMIGTCSNIGFMADEVKKKLPQYVYNYCGFMIIDYDALTEHLEATYNA